nr:cation/H(+) antiporter 18-like [Ipomoea batatas]GME09612.1 cation/H(+) antiporter 18-like [Ipomoea batatas]
MHLMELSERSSAILMCHKARKNGLPFWNTGGEPADSTEIVVAFETFEHLSKVSIRPSTAISAMSSMHEDIIASAEGKRVAMIILPFHKHQKIDGHFETTRNELRHVNRRVLEGAPCSVGILVDRGLGGTSHVSASNVDYTITVLYFGGHDDREALAYGARMVEHPGICLVVARFILDPDTAGTSVKLDVSPNGSPEEEKSRDEDFLAGFKLRNSTNSSVKYEEKVVKDAAETVEAIRGYNRCNLLVVGRMPEGEIVAAMNNKSECPELGPLGNLLSCKEFSTTASVLVVQQYRRDLSKNGLKEEDSADGEYEST